MKSTRKKWKPILWVEALGFGLLIVLSWLTEVIGLPHFIFGESFTPNWQRAALRTVVITLVWLAVHLATHRLLKQLHHLEKFLRICGWCRKVCYEGQWLTLEKYFDSKFDTRTTHGMCPDCVQKEVAELKQRKSSSSISKS